MLVDEHLQGAANVAFLEEMLGKRCHLMVETAVWMMLSYKLLRILVYREQYYRLVFWQYVVHHHCSCLFGIVVAEYLFSLILVEFFYWNDGVSRIAEDNVNPLVVAFQHIFALEGVLQVCRNRDGRFCGILNVSERILLRRCV